MKRLAFWLALLISLAFLLLCDVPVIGQALAWLVIAAWLMCGAVWMVGEVQR